MKHITIGIPDKLYNSILELFKQIPSITISEEADTEVPEWQKKVVRERIKNAKSEKFKPYTDVRKKIKKKYGL